MKEPPSIAPDGRHILTVYPIEMQPTHWVKRPLILESETHRLVLDLRDTLCGISRTEWRGDGSHLLLEMQRFPGDAPGVSVDLDLTRDTAEVRAPSESDVIALSKLYPWLEGYYVRSCSTEVE